MLMVDRDSGNEQGFISVAIAGIMGVLFIGAAVFALTSYTENQDLKNNLNIKVAEAVEIAVQKAESTKDTEFVEKEKEPLRTYNGSVTYGSLSFQYPKTWSVYEVESTSGNVIDIYANPGTVPGLTSKKPYALRVQITSTTYEKELNQIDNLMKNGSLKSVTFRPAKVDSVLGIKASGQITTTLQGSIVLLPLRDRTIKIFTESQEFTNDFENLILPSIKFTP